MGRTTVILGFYKSENANLPLIPPFLQPDNPDYSDGVNFASAGAGALVETYQGKVINLHTQLRNYKKVKVLLKDKYGDVGTKKMLSKAVHLISVGADDYLAILLSNTSIFAHFTAPQYANMVVANITSVVMEIYRAGGRKFGFLNVPQVGCMPEVRIRNVTGNGECDKEASIYPTLHNQALYQALQQLQLDLPGFKYSLYDLFSHLQQFIDLPFKYGYKEGITACCGSGKFNAIASCGRAEEFKEFELCKDIDDHVFWDSTHLTEKVHKMFVDEMWSNSTGTLCYGQYTIRDLFDLP